jgi:hypothetical protein
MAYLLLCVACPQLALDEHLAPLRQYIHSGTAAEYRPYSEEFVPGAWPGFDASVLVQAKSIATQPNEIGVYSIMVHLRLHHVRYFLALHGTVAPDFSQFDPTVHFYGEAAPGGEASQETVSFAFDDMIPRTR